jgi:hypothetical protein
MEAVWETRVPAAVEAPRHPRVVHEVFNDGAFVFEPSRETFFDMLRQAVTVDSAEQRSDGSVVSLASLFFTGYFLHVRPDSTYSFYLASIKSQCRHYYVSGRKNYCRHA